MTLTTLIVPASHCELALTEEKKKKTNNSDFQFFQIGHLVTVSIHSYCYCRVGQPISCSMLVDTSMCCMAKALTYKC